LLLLTPLLILPAAEATARRRLGFLRLIYAHMHTLIERHTNTIHTHTQAKRQRIRVPHLMANKLTSG